MTYSFQQMQNDLLVKYVSSDDFFNLFSGINDREEWNKKAKKHVQLFYSVPMEPRGKAVMKPWTEAAKHDTDVYKAVKAAEKKASSSGGRKTSTKKKSRDKELKKLKGPQPRGAVPSVAYGGEIVSSKDPLAIGKKKTNEEKYFCYPPHDIDDEDLLAKRKLWWAEIVKRDDLEGPQARFPKSNKLEGEWRYNGHHDDLPAMTKEDCTFYGIDFVPPLPKEAKAKATEESDDEGFATPDEDQPDEDQPDEESSEDEENSSDEEEEEDSKPPPPTQEELTKFCDKVIKARFSKKALKSDKELKKLKKKAIKALKKDAEAFYKSIKDDDSWTKAFKKQPTVTWAV